MRLVKVKAPAGKGTDVAQVAFGVGIAEVAVHHEVVYGPNQQHAVKDAVDIDTATPTAKAFIEALMAAPFFDPQAYTIAVRQPRSVVSRAAPAQLTWPIVVPTVDVFEELWQFNHVTFSFLIRVLIAALLLAYGMMQAHLLLMIAGLLFLPFLPLLLAIGLGLQTRAWRLAGQGAFALAVGTLLLVVGGAIVAVLSAPPMHFQQFSPLRVSFFISLGVGIAAGLATADDVGRRELIGLAATAQVAVIPAWVGIALVHGFAATTATSSPTQRLLAFGVNLATIVVVASGTYAVLGMRGDGVRRFTTGTERGEEEHPSATT